MPHVWLDKRTDPAVYRFEYREWLGPQALGFKSRRRTGTGLAVDVEGGAPEAKRLTLLKAQQVQAQYDAIRVGWADPPKSTDLGRHKLFADIAAEYLAWGRAQGGRRGFGWGGKHAEKRAFYLNFWAQSLGLVKLGDVEGCLPRVEKALRVLQRKGSAGKTLNNYAEGLAAFLAWCVERGHLAANHLDGLAPFDATPKTVRRALTVAEIRAFLDGCEGERSTIYSRRRRLGYELALASGLRRGELTSLQVKHLDTKRGGVLLPAATAKNRRETFQPLPAALVARLAQASAGKPQEAPLVFVPRESSNAVKKDLERVGLSRWSQGLLENGTIGRGKVDFHALRVAYVNLILGAGADAKTAQTLARHSTPALTMNVYGKVRTDRVEAATEALGRAILPAATIQTPYKKAVGAEGVELNEAGELACVGEKMVGREGFEPP